MNIDETTERLKECLEKIKKGFQDNSYSNESSISRQVVEPILRYMEWPTEDADVVKYEYSLGGMRADIALFHEGKVRVVVEVKKPGSADGAEEQLFNYTYHAGVSLAVLTTGEEWEFYLPLKPGRYQDRQVYKLDISARKTEDSVSRLMRYLFYPDVGSGKAIERAEADHGDKTRAEDIQKALPNAWNKILSECDDSLIELLQDKVGDICGFRADSDIVKAFIKKQPGKTLIPHQPQQSIPSNSVREKFSKKTSDSKTKLIGFELHSRKYDARNGADTLYTVFEELIKLDAYFPDRFMQIHPGKKRPWLANKQCDLYPNQDEDFCRIRYRRLPTGHWVNINYSMSNIEDIIKAACKVAGIQYGKDLKLRYG